MVAMIRKRPGIAKPKRPAIAWRPSEAQTLWFNL